MLVGRRQARRHRDPRLLLQAQARPARRRLPHVPGGNRRHSQAATGCSTPVKDGMVVHTQSERVKVAQERSVEFLLINHPLDCPYATKAASARCRTSPSAGQRHLALHRAQAPLRQAAGALAPDRDRPRALRPLLPLHALLAGDSEDYQLVLQERRRAPLLRVHLRWPPLRGPVQRQHRGAVPRRRADVARLPLPARPWDIKDSGSVCTLYPAQCNVTLHGAR